MLQFKGDQFNLEELKYIYSALMMVKVSGDEARTLVNLQDKAMNFIQMAENPPILSTPKNSLPPGAKLQNK